MHDDVALWERELDDHNYDDRKLGMIARGELPWVEPGDQGWRWREGLVMLIAMILIAVGLFVGLPT